MPSHIISAAGRTLQRIEEVILAFATLLIAVLTIVNVVCRTFFGFSLAVAQEVSQFCIIIVCFVGLSYAASKGRHIRMTAIYDSLPLTVRKLFMIGISACTSLLMFALAWYAVLYVRTVYELGGVYPALRVPFYVIYTVAPIGLCLAGVQYALATLKNVTSDDIYLSFEKKDEYEQPVTQEI